MMICPQPQPSLLQIPTGAGSASPVIRCRPPKEKVVVVMGATGTGKSRLSIDLATRYTGEVINSDKIQMHVGLDVATNKITDEESAGVPHHLLGIVDPDTDFTADKFVANASNAMQAIIGRGKLPIIAGGSNSFIEALIDDRNYEFRSQYDVCFLSVHVEMPVLHRFVSNRVDRMVNAGMVDEIRDLYKPNADYTKGIRRAIGVPEFDYYFRSQYSSSVDNNNNTRAQLLQQAINETKINTCKLASRQIKKINRLRDKKGWEIHRLDATGFFQNNGQEADELWEEKVAGPGSVIVNQFLFDFGRCRSIVAAAEDDWRANKRPAAMAGAYRYA